MYTFSLSCMILISHASDHAWYKHAPCYAICTAAHHAACMHEACTVRIEARMQLSSVRHHASIYGSEGPSSKYNAASAPSNLIFSWIQNMQTWISKAPIVWPNIGSDWSRVDRRDALVSLKILVPSPNWITFVPSAHARELHAEAIYSHETWPDQRSFFGWPQVQILQNSGHINKLLKDASCINRDTCVYCLHVYMTNENDHSVRTANKKEKAWKKFSGKDDNSEIIQLFSNTS